MQYGYVVFVRSYHLTGSSIRYLYDLQNRQIVAIVDIYIYEPCSSVQNGADFFKKIFYQNFLIFLNQNESN